MCSIRAFPLPDILEQRGAAVNQYGDVLQELGSADFDLASRLAAQEEDAKKLASTELPEGFSYTIILLKELATAQEWILLRNHSQRHADSLDPDVAICAKRMLALGLAHSDEAADRKAAMEIYRRLAEQTPTDFTDIGNLAILLTDDSKEESHSEAKALVLDGINRYPLKADYFMNIGQRIVEATGDRRFRQRIEALVKARGKRA